MLTLIAPLIIYLLSFPIMIATLFRVEIGILFFILTTPIIVLKQKMILFPLGNHITDFLLVALIIGWFLRALREKARVFRSSPINVVVVLIVLGSIVSLIRGITFMALPEDIALMRLSLWKNYMILPVVYFISINNIEKEDLVKLIIACICFSLLAMDLNFYTTFRWLKGEHYSHSIRISGPFAFLGPNELGIFYSMYTFLLLGLAYFIENKKLKYFVLFVCACNVYPILFSYSRSGYVCAIAGIFILGLLKDRKLFILLVALLIFYKFILPSSVVERIDGTFLDKEEISEEQERESVFDIGDVQVEVTGRKHLWEKAMRYFEQEPFLGIGFDSFRQSQGAITHGIFHRILAEEGLVGMTIFSMFIITVLWQSFRLFRHSKSKLGQGIGLGFFTCVLIHLVGSITGDTFVYYNMMAIYWLFLGVVASFNARDRSEKPSHV